MTVYSTGVDCGGPPELRNGRISNTSSMTTTYNSTVKYECDDGFEFIGAIDMSRTCLASGNWSNGEFMCSELYGSYGPSSAVCCHLLAHND